MRISTQSNQSSQNQHYQGAGQQSHTPGVQSNKKMNMSSFQSNQTTSKGNGAPNPSINKWHQNAEDIMRRTTSNHRQNEYGSVDHGYSNNPSVVSQENIHNAMRSIDYPEADSKVQLLNYNHKMQTIQHGKSVVVPESQGRSKSKEPMIISQILNTINYQNQSYSGQGKKQGGSKSRGNSSQGRQQMAIQKQNLVPKQMHSELVDTKNTQQISTMSQQNKQQIIQQVLGQVNNGSKKRANSSSKPAKLATTSQNSQNLPKSSTQTNQQNLKKGSVSAKQKTSNNNQLKGIMAAAIASVKDAHNNLNNINRDKKAKEQKVNQFQSMDDHMRELLFMQGHPVNQKYMTEIINQKISPSQTQSGQIDIPMDTANLIRNKLINSDEDQNTRRILSDLGTVNISNKNHAQNKQEAQTKESPEYINTDNEYEDTSEIPKARTAKNQKKNQSIRFSEHVQDSEIEAEQLDHLHKYDSVLNTNITTAGRIAKQNPERSLSQNARKAYPNAQASGVSTKLVNIPSNSTGLQTSQPKAASTSGADRNADKVSNQQYYDKLYQDRHQIGQQSQSVSIPIERHGSAISEIEFGSILNQLGEQKNALRNFETHQMQISQRIDIFEEEIIKRVREIQKYSKALNNLVRKNVMVDVKKLEERMLNQPLQENHNQENKPQPKHIDANQLEEFKDRIERLRASMEDQQEDHQKFQENMQGHLDKKFSLIQSQFEQFERSIKHFRSSYEEEHPLSNKNLDLKLSEHTQLFGLMDEQLNQQDANMQQIMQVMMTNESAEDQFKKLYSYIDQKAASIESKVQSNFKKEEPKHQVVNNVDFDRKFQELASILENQNEAVQAVEEQVKKQLAEFENILHKQSQEAEGRDGLIFQQNQDLNNLYQANQQILENEKAFREQIDNIENQIAQVEPYMEKFAPLDQVQEIINELQTQMQEDVEKLVADALEQQLPELHKQTKQMIETLRTNQEGRLQLSIDSLKEELINQIRQMKQHEQVTNSISEIQKQQELTVIKVQGMEKHLKKYDDFQTALKNLEFQLQAQFDEQASQVEEQLKIMETNFSENLQQVMLNQERDKIERSEQAMSPNNVQNGDLVHQSDLELIHNIITQHQESLTLIQEEIGSLKENEKSKPVNNDDSIEELKQKTEAIESDIDVLNRKLQAIEHELDEQMSNLAENQEQISGSTQQCFEQLESYKVQTDSQLHRLEQLIEDLHKSLRELPASAGSSYPCLSNKINEISDQVNVLKDQFEELAQQQSEISTQVGEIQAWAEQNLEDANCRLLESLESAEQQTETKLAGLISRINEMPKQIKQELLSDLHQSRIDLDRKLSDLQSEFTATVKEQEEKMITQITETQQLVEARLHESSSHLQTQLEVNLKEITSRIEDIQSKEIAHIAIEESKLHHSPDGLLEDLKRLDDADSENPKFDNEKFEDEAEIENKLNTLFKRQQMESPDSKLLDQIFQQTSRDEGHESSPQEQRLSRPEEDGHQEGSMLQRDQTQEDEFGEGSEHSDDEHQMHDEIEDQLDLHNLNQQHELDHDSNQQIENEGRQEDGNGSFEDNYDDDFEYDGNDDVLGLAGNVSQTQQKVSINSIQLEDQQEQESSDQPEDRSGFQESYDHTPEETSEELAERIASEYLGELAEVEIENLIREVVDRRQ